MAAYLLCIARRLPEIKITAVECDLEIADLARQNVVNNGFQKRVNVVHSEIANLPQVFFQNFDHVVCNPPFNFDQGTKPKNIQKTLATVGIEGQTGLVAWVKTAVWAAKVRSRISFICRADRGAELITLLTQAGVAETIIFPLRSRPRFAAGRLIITARKAVRGPSSFLPGLVVHNEDGSFTPAAAAIMSGKALKITRARC